MTLPAQCGLGFTILQHADEGGGGGYRDDGRRAEGGKGMVLTIGSVVQGGCLSREREREGVKEFHLRRLLPQVTCTHDSCI